jgi:hypothetical protein
MVGFSFSGSPMHSNITTTTSTRMQKGTDQIAELREDANEVQIAEHIRGMVAATMGNLSLQASDATRNEAGKWQDWELGVADGCVVAAQKR